MWYIYVYIEIERKEFFTLDIKNIKTYLASNHEKIKYILEELGCHHIKYHSGSGVDSYYTYANPDGDNPTANTVYVSPSLLTISYTRDICHEKSACDLIDYVNFYRKDSNFFQNIKWITEKSDLDYYHNFEEGIPESLKILKLLKDLLNKESDREDEDEPIEIKDEKILTYYNQNLLSGMFLKDGIDFQTQKLFEIGYDYFSNRITIPIRSEIGDLVGVKSRYLFRKVPEGELKYMYLEKCAKSKILYGYHLSNKYISESTSVFITEAEKGCMQFFSHGIQNVVSTGGTSVSRQQIEKLSRLNKTLILSFDSDFTEDKICRLRNKFLEQVSFSAIIDREGILNEKESPSDNPEKLDYLIKNHIYVIEKVKEI